MRSGADLGGPTEPRINAVEISHGKGQFFNFFFGGGLSSPLKTIGSLCCGVLNKGIIQSLITARPAKAAMRHFAKIL